MKHEEEFGQFGDLRPAKVPLLRRIRPFLLVFAFCALFPAAYVGWTELYVNVLERESPQVAIHEPPVGLGLSPLTLKFDVSDADSGLAEVIVRSEDDQGLKDLLRKTYTEELRHADTVIVDLPGRESGIKEGDATSIVVTVFDRSYWRNRRQLSMPLKADFTRPVLAMVTQSPAGVSGGALVAFYRVNDNDEVFSGLKLGQWFFPGFSAQKLDKDFAAMPDVNFSFYSFPPGLDPGEKLTLFARDDVGNISTLDVPYNVRPGESTAREVRLNRGTLEGAVEKLYLKYLQVESRLNSRQFAAPEPAHTDEELLRRFRLISQDFPALLEQTLKPLFARPKALRLWRGPFIRQRNSAIKSPFGETRRYVFEGQQAGSAVNYGVDLAVESGVPIEAANDGIVIFKDEFGLYGITVIVDHGFGVTSIYANLGSASVSEGDRVHKGQTVGEPGATGLADGNMVHFEIRLYGTPVRPNEWWDPKWVGENIEDRIVEMKKQLGLKLYKPL